MSIYVAGLTGQTGSGKSTVADIFRAHGVCVIDCDKLAREIVEPGSPVLIDLARLFGDDLILPDGSLDRHKLARRAFASEENTNLLNSVTHPAITTLARKRVAEAEKNGYKIAMLDAPVLLASELLGDCRAVICVCAPKDQRMARLMSRDEIAPGEIERRMSAQPDEKYYRDNSDIIIENPDGCDPTEQCIKALESLKIGG